MISFNPSNLRSERAAVSTVCFQRRASTGTPYEREIERQFLTEFDYREEAKNLEEVRANVLPRWSHKVDIPAPHRQLCTREVLVMDEVPGVKLVDGRGLALVTT